ncbi:MAG TPA: hypothetical protein VFR83_03835, partial [Burkholderiales bacterium]|nr:hypothetical protein [Burkholderiales bacterium]
ARWRWREAGYAWQRQPCSAPSQPHAVAQLQAGRASLGAAASWQPHWQASPAQGAQVQRSFMAWFMALFIESSFSVGWVRRTLAVR